MASTSKGTTDLWYPEDGLNWAFSSFDGTYESYENVPVECVGNIFCFKVPQNVCDIKNSVRDFSG